MGARVTTSLSPSWYTAAMLQGTQSSQGKWGTPDAKDARSAGSSKARGAAHAQQQRRTHVKPGSYGLSPADNGKPMNPLYPVPSTENLLTVPPSAAAAKLASPPGARSGSSRSSGVSRLLVGYTSAQGKSLGMASCGGQAGEQQQKLQCTLTGVLHAQPPQIGVRASVRASRAHARLQA